MMGLLKRSSLDDVTAVELGPTFSDGLDHTRPFSSERELVQDVFPPAPGSSQAPHGSRFATT